MIKAFDIVDNILVQPEYYRHIALNCRYYTNETRIISGLQINNGQDKPTAYWRGYRSDPLHLLDKNLFVMTFNDIIAKIFDVDNFDYTITAFFHLSPGFVDVSNKDFHTDDYLLAGIIFLNTIPEKNSGTIINVGNEQIVIDNVFNRCAIYKSKFNHRPEKFFGDTIETCRLTLPFFISRLNIATSSYR